MTPPHALKRSKSKREYIWNHVKSPTAKSLFDATRRWWICREIKKNASSLKLNLFFFNVWDFLVVSWTTQTFRLPILLGLWESQLHVQNSLEDCVTGNVDKHYCHLTTQFHYEQTCNCFNLKYFFLSMSTYLDNQYLLLYCTNWRNWTLLCMLRKSASKNLSFYRSLNPQPVTLLEKLLFWCSGLD